MSARWFLILSLAVRGHLDVAMHIGAEDGARLEAAQRFGRG